MKTTLQLAAFCCALTLIACDRKPLQPQASATPEPPRASHALPPLLPALYTGTLPCADCEGIRYELDLRANQMFVLRMTYLGQSPASVHDEIGQWSIHDDKVLTLDGDGQTSNGWSLRDADTLVMLDLRGQPIVSTLNYAITRQPTYASLEPRLTMRGMYRTLADATTFEECSTGLTLPVASEGDNVALQTAYAAARTEPGTSLLASVEGRIASRPSMDGERPVDTLLVDKFVRFWRNESCGARGVTHDLASTRWVLTQLNDAPVDMSTLQREPFIALENQEHRVVGYAGCNRIIGGYRQDGAQIAFEQLSLTRMACSNMPFETAFSKALQAAARWQISDAHLELFDMNGATVARFEARNL